MQCLQKYIYRVANCHASAASVRLSDSHAHTGNLTADLYYFITNLQLATSEQKLCPTSVDLDHRALWPVTGVQELRLRVCYCFLSTVA